MSKVMIENVGRDDWAELDVDDETIALALKYGDIRPSTIPAGYYNDGLPNYIATSDAALDRIIDAVRMSQK